MSAESETMRSPLTEILLTNSHLIVEGKNGRRVSIPLEEFRSDVESKTAPWGGLSSLTEEALHRRFDAFVFEVYPDLWEFPSDRRSAVESAGRRGKVVTPPGSRIVRVLDFFFSRKTMTHVFDPTIADLRFEHSKALAEGRPHKAKWVHVKYIWSLGATALARACVSFGRVIWKLWQLSRG